MIKPRILPSFWQKTLFISLLLISCQALLADPGSQSNQKILVFGDSLSAAYNLPIEAGWVPLLQQNLAKEGFDLTFANASISGETSSGGLTRLQAQLARHHPKIVILELGANDALRGFELKSTRANLAKMIEMSHKMGAMVLLAGIHIPPNYGRTYTRQFDQLFLDLSKIDGVSLIPFILEGVALNPKLMQNDGLHPNEKGQKRVLLTVKQYLLPMLTNQPTK